MAFETTLSPSGNAPFYFSNIKKYIIMNINYVVIRISRKILRSKC